MRLFSIEFNKNEALYIQLYNFLKKEILNGNLKANDPIPSKRKLSTHLNISLNTIMEAYNMLISEGLIISIPKKGFFVSNYNIKINNINYQDLKTKEKIFKYDLTTKNIDNTLFPYFTWNKISKNIIYNENIFERTSSYGYYKLRNTIKEYLYETKGINVNPTNIIIGSGIEYLFTILIDIIDKNNYAVENPGYDKIAKILKNHNKNIEYMEIDNAGAIIDNIKSDVIYITPSSQFPLGIKMSMERKLEISSWAKDKYIIEDSFDSEFKYLSNQSISLFELNNNTILLSSYSRSISPALRIAYMILPDKLLNRYDEKYGFYSTTVSTLDQMILNEFIASGAYSRHINKVKNSYIEKKELIKNILEKENIKIAYDGYLSMIIDIDDLNKEKFIKKCMEYKIDISLLDDYYLNKKTNKIIIGYSGININLIGEAISLLTKAIKESKVA